MKEKNLKAKIKMAFKVSLVLCLLVFFNTSDLLAENITEGSEWAQDAMKRWQDYGILNGTSYGTLAPSDELNKVQAITILNRINNVEIETNHDESRFKDVESFRWYYKEVEKAIATGLIEGDSEGKINPKETLTREIGFSMIAKLFNISYLGTDSENYLKEYIINDYNEIGNWSKDAIAGLLELGYIEGDGDGCLRPKDVMTRGEFIKLLDNIVDVYIYEKGDYDLSGVEGNIIINVPGVNLSNVSEYVMIYAMAGSNGEIQLDEEDKELVSIVNAGMVNSNVDYSSYRANIYDMRNKKLVELKLICNMPTADDLNDTDASAFIGRVKGTDEWNEIIYKVSKEEEIDPIFVKCIMTKESGGTMGCKNYNKNGTIDYGLMQVNSSSGYTQEELDRMLVDAEFAIRCGIKMIKRKIYAAEVNGQPATVFNVAWRYNGYSEKGHDYAVNFSKLYNALSKMDSETTLVRVTYGE